VSYQDYAGGEGTALAEWLDLLCGKVVMLTDPHMPIMVVPVRPLL
jgi:hypothetical protein